MRPSSPELSRAFAAGSPRTGSTSTLIGLCCTDGLYYASGALDLPGAMFTASHNPAQYNGIKLCRSEARPVGQDSGLAEVRDLAQQLLDAGASAGPRRRRGPASSSATCWATTRPSCAAWSTCPARGRSRSSSTPATAWAATPCPPCSARAAGLPELPLEVVPLYFELDGTFPNHEANPLEPENLRDLQARRRRARRRHRPGLRRRRRPLLRHRRARRTGQPERHHRAGRHPRDRQQVARAPRPQTSPSSTTSSPRPPSPRSSPSGAPAPVRTRVGHSFIKAEMARDGRRVRRGALARTTTSATSGSPTPACSRRCTSWPRSASRTSR